MNVRKIRLMDIATIIAVLFILCVVVPLVVVGMYNVPSMDDYSNGIDAYNVYRETGSVWRAMLAAWGVMTSIYMSWQGSFSAVFLMALEPGIWGENGYAVATPIILGGYLVGVFAICHAVFCKVLNSSKRIATIVACVIGGVGIYWVPSPVESFYWWTGSIYYTFYMGLMLLLFAKVIYCIYKKQITAWDYVWSLLLAFFIGGGNYVTGLICFEVLFLFTVGTLWKKHKAKIYILATQGMFLVSFAINALAPGNRVRASEGGAMAPLESIIMSLRTGIDYASQWTTSVVIVEILLLLPFLWKALEKVTFEFRYPVAVTVITGGMFCSHFTPTFFAQSSQGPWRVLDLVYYAYWFLLIGNVTYWLGWVRNRLNVAVGDAGIDAVLYRAVRKYIPYYMIGCMILLMAILPYYGYQNGSSYIALQSLRSGEARQYKAEFLERVHILETSEEDDVLLPEYSMKPRLLFVDDIDVDASSWQNYSMARYYGKKSVARISAQD